MKYVLIRDDDTCARTPPECLERLYRPYLEKGLPVNLSVIPNVRTDVKAESGELEGYLTAAMEKRAKPGAGNLPITENRSLIDYLADNPGYHALHHGYEHQRFEFDLDSRVEAMRRLDEGAEILADAGLSSPETFVAPQDKISAESYRELAERFRVISTGWFEWRRLPRSWRPAYVWTTKIRRRPHWNMGHVDLLSHPGCLLSYNRDYEKMLETVKSAVASQEVTVLVTHWWEYFINGKADDAFISILHQVAEFLHESPDISVISFKEISSR